MQRIWSIICGSYTVLTSLIRFAFPTFLTSEKWYFTVQRSGKEKEFLLSSRINGIILGSICILAGLLPEPQQTMICAPLLTASCISILACNKIFIGRFWLPKDWLPKGWTIKQPSSADK